MELPALSSDRWPVLVTGARGLLGTALGPRLAASAPRPQDLVLTDLEDLDVTDGPAVARAIAGLPPRTILHLAAWTDVDGAERHRDEARRVNVLGTEHAARAAAKAGALLVLVSTDFVFDGTKDGPYTEEDSVSPHSWYGRTKAEAEAAARALAPDHLLIRTAWLYGAGGRNFVDTILAKARRGERLRVVADQVGCPTWTQDLARGLLALVQAGARGTFHVAAGGAASRRDLAEEAVRAAGLEVRVEAIRTADLPGGIAPRPARVVLSTDKFAGTVGWRLPDWRESVRAYVAPRYT
jgi:dTDP-4-dehydrorhamnose reductase